jgi:protein-tyrosine-phosphatase
MPFPVALGVDFPFAWYQLLLHDVELPRARYRVGAYGRNVMQDYNYFRRRLSDLKHQPWQAARFAVGWLSDLGRVVTGRDSWDALVLDDPTPGLRELSGAVVSKIQQTVERLPGWRVVRRRRARGRLAAALQRDGNGAVVVFLCEGNICRSPFAALQLERFLDAHGHKPVLVSAGMLPLQDRSPPRSALLAARERGVDVSAHRSRHLSRDLAEKASAIIVFDDRNRQSVKARYPELRAPVLSLCDFMDDYAYYAVHDPFGHGPAAFRAAYARITDGNRAIAELLRSGRTSYVRK